MNNQKLSTDDVAILRKRVEFEDQLLNSRTSIVLTLNGLIAVAVGLTLPPFVKLVISLIIIVINVLWIVCSLDAQHLIHSLTAKIQDSDQIPIDERIRKHVRKNRFRIGSTKFMATIIPALLLFAWILGLLLIIHAKHYLIHS